MKKKLIIVIAALLVCACGISAALILTHEENYTTLEERAKAVYDYRTFGGKDYLQHYYESMKERADIIAIARSADQLTEENSVAGRSGWGALYSLRQVEILEAIKGDSEGILVNQTCAIRDDGKIESECPCIPMIEGDVYALFLYKWINIAYGATPRENVYAPLSEDNGLLNLSYLKLNRRADLAAMVAIDLFGSGSELPADVKDAYLKSREVCFWGYNPVFTENEYEWTSITVTTPHTHKGMEALVEYTIVDGVYYFRAAGFSSYYDGTWGQK